MTAQAKGNGLGRLAAAAVAVAVLSPGAPRAVAAERTYPETLLDLPAPPPDDLLAFADSAAEAASRADTSRIGGTDELEEHLADRVRLYIGDVELTEGENFEFRDEYNNWFFLRSMGQIGADRRNLLSEAEKRAAETIAELLDMGVIGQNPWMPTEAGEYCTGSWGRLPEATLRSLMAATDSHLSDWRIAAEPWEAAGFMGRTGVFEWTVGALLLVDPDAPRPENCCWDKVVKPDGSGGYVSRPYFDPVLRPYLNSHVCFARQEGEWKISAVGIRTP